MYKILEIKQINEVEYNIKLIESYSNDIFIMNIINTSKIHEFIFDSSKNEIITPNNNTIKLDDNFSKKFSNNIDGVKNMFSKAIASGIIAISLSLQANANNELNNDNIMTLNNFSIVHNDSKSNDVFLEKKTKQTNNNKEYEELFVNLQELLIDQFYKQNEKELKSKNITKDKIKNEMILQIDPNNNFDNNFAMSFMGNEIPKENLKNVKDTINQVLETRVKKENIIIGSLDANDIIKNKGMISLSFPKDLINKVLDNIDNQEYLKSFLSYTYNFSNHELSHLYFNTNEFKAVEQQTSDITSKEFKNDLIELNPNAKLSFEILELSAKSLLEKQDLNSINHLYKNIDKNEIKDSFSNIKTILLDKKNINEYLNNEVSNENTLLYSSGNRDLFKNTKFINNSEYLTTIVQDEKFILKDLSDKDKKHVDLNKFVGKQVEFIGGHIYNMMLALEENNASDLDKDLFKKLSVKDLVESLTDEEFNPNKKEHTIFFEKYSKQLDKIEDLAMSKALKLDKNEYSFNDR